MSDLEKRGLELAERLYNAGGLTRSVQLGADLWGACDAINHAMLPDRADERDIWLDSALRCLDRAVALTRSEATRKLVTKALEWCGEARRAGSASASKKHVDE